jgi:restriction system protein
MLPTSTALMLPLLKQAASSEEVVFAAVVTQITDAFDITFEDRREAILSGKSPSIAARLDAARQLLIKARLIEKTRRGRLKITQLGRSVVASNPPTIDHRYLRQLQRGEIHFD